MTHTPTQTQLCERTQNRMRRDKEFLAFYDEALDLLIDHKVAGARGKALRLTLQLCQPRYYLDYQHAYPIVCGIIRHGRCNKTMPLHRDMWNELADKVQAVIDVSGLSIAKALEFVLMHGRASRFFLTEPYAKDNLLRAHKDRQQRLDAIERRKQLLKEFIAA